MGGGAVTYEYKVSTADDSTYTSANPTNAGNYTVRATVAPTTDYNGAVATKDFSILKAPINPTVTMEGWTYGENPNEPSLTGNTGNGEVTYDYKVSNAPDETYVSTKPSSAGVYTVRATIAETVNYKAASALTNFTISPMSLNDNAAVTVDIIDPTYDGTSLVPTVTVTVEGVPLTEGVDYDLVVTPETDAGEYVLQIEFKNNYDGDFEYPWYVEPAEMGDITFKDNINDTFVYGDEIPGDKFPVEGLPNDLNDYAIVYKWADKDGNELDEAPTDAGGSSRRARRRRPPRWRWRCAWGQDRPAPSSAPGRPAACSPRPCWRCRLHGATAG